MGPLASLYLFAYNATQACGWYVSDHLARNNSDSPSKYIDEIWFALMQDTGTDKADFERLFDKFL